MIPPIQRTILERISALCELFLDIRIGQLVANLEFLSEDFANQSLWQIEDDEFLNVIEIHHAQMSRRLPRKS